MSTFQAGGSEGCFQSGDGGGDQGEDRGCRPAGPRSFYELGEATLSVKRTDSMIVFLLQARYIHTSTNEPLLTQSANSQIITRIEDAPAAVLMPPRFAPLRARAMIFRPRSASICHSGLDLSTTETAVSNSTSTPEG